MWDVESRVLYPVFDTGVQPQEAVVTSLFPDVADSLDRAAGSGDPWAAMTLAPLAATLLRRYHAALSRYANESPDWLKGIAQEALSE